MKKMAKMAKIAKTTRKATRHKENTVQQQPGTYALLLSSATNAVIRVGRFGDLHLQPGFYVYVGSALGPGGVRARIAHHNRPAERPHWHIDYLRPKMTLEGAWLRYGRKSLECQWARRFAAMLGASMPMPGFGSSDCDCESHLFLLGKRPARSLRPTATRLGSTVTYCAF